MLLDRGNHGLSTGRLDVALEFSTSAAGHRKARVGSESLWPHDPEQRLVATNNAAWHRNLVGRPSEARPLYQWIKVHTDEGTELHVAARGGIDRALHLSGDPEGAVAALEVALHAAARLDDADPRLLPELQWHLAAALRDAGGELGRSRTLAADALLRYERDSPDDGRRLRAD